jgi:hypothetical protein
MLDRALGDLRPPYLTRLDAARAAAGRSIVVVWRVEQNHCQRLRVGNGLDDELSFFGRDGLIDDATAPLQDGSHRSHRRLQPVGL